MPPTIFDNIPFAKPKSTTLRTIKFIALGFLLFASQYCEAIGGGSPSTGTQSHHPYDHNKDLEKLKTHAQTSPIKVVRRASSSLGQHHDQGSWKSSMEADENPSTGAADDDVSDVAKSRVVMMGLKNGFVRHSAAIDNVVTNILEASEVIERSSVFDFEKDRRNGKDEKKTNQE
jgi:hypothetical protein